MRVLSRHGDMRPSIRYGAKTLPAFRWSVLARCSMAPMNARLLLAMLVVAQAVSGTQKSQSPQSPQTATINAEHAELAERTLALAAQEPKNWTTAEDHQNMMAQLG